jgi:hypothetical protein
VGDTSKTSSTKVSLHIQRLSPTPNTHTPPFYEALLVSQIQTIFCGYGRGLGRISQQLFNWLQNTTFTA